MSSSSSGTILLLSFGEKGTHKSSGINAGSGLICAGDIVSTDNKSRGDGAEAAAADAWVDASIGVGRGAQPVRLLQEGGGSATREKFIEDEHFGRARAGPAVGLGGAKQQKRLQQPERAPYPSAPHFPQALPYNNRVRREAPRSRSFLRRTPSGENGKGGGSKHIM